MKKKFKNPFKRIFYGVKKIPSHYTLQLVHSNDLKAARSYPAGIDFGASSLKLVQVGVENNKNKVVKLIAEEYPLELRGNPMLRKKHQGETLKKVVKKNKIRGNVVAALPSSLVQMKIANLPPMPEKEVEAAVKWELKQTNPHPLNELAFDYYILNHSEDKGYSIMLVSCLKLEVVDLVRIIKSAKLNPIALEINCSASAELLMHNCNDKQKEEVVIVLEFGCQSCTISIIMKDTLYFKRDLEISGDTLTLGISNKCQVEYNEAEELKHKYGLRGLSQQASGFTGSGNDRVMEVNESLWLHMEDLIHEISYTFKYFSHQIVAGEVNKFDKIVISGGSANIKNFASCLQNYIGVPVETVNPFKMIPLSSDIEYNYNDLSELSPRMAVAMGLALREVTK